MTDTYFEVLPWSLPGDANKGNPLCKRSGKDIDDRGPILSATWSTGVSLTHDELVQLQRYAALMEV